MPDVRYTTPRQEVIKAPVKFIVTNEDGRIGELRVNSRGMRWWPKGKKISELVEWTDVGRRFSGKRSRKR